MYCQKCGRQLPDGTVNCPACDPIIVNPEPQTQQKNSFFRSAGKGSKSYAALFTALLVFPATICTAKTGWK